MTGPPVGVAFVQESQLHEGEYPKMKGMRKP